MKQYNVKACSCRWLGIELLDEIEDGTFVEVAEDVPDDYTTTTSNDGVLLAVKNNAKSATISITVRGSSRVNRQLDEIRRLSNTTMQIGPMVFSDPSGPGAGSGFVATNTFILGRSAFSRGSGALSPVTWRFKCEFYEERDGGVADLVVGA